MENIYVNVAYHQSGNYTLKTKLGDDSAFKDEPPGSELFVNNDEAKFYKAAAKKIAELSEKYCVIYTDTGP